LFSAERVKIHIWCLACAEKESVAI